MSHQEPLFSSSDSSHSNKYFINRCSMYGGFKWLKQGIALIFNLGFIPLVVFTLHTLVSFGVFLIVYKDLIFENQWHDGYRLKMFILFLFFFIVYVYITSLIFSGLVYSAEQKFSQGYLSVKKFFLGVIRKPFTILGLYILLLLSLSMFKHIFSMIFHVFIASGIITNMKFFNCTFLIIFLFINVIFVFSIILMVCRQMPMIEAIYNSVIACCKNILPIIVFSCYVFILSFILLMLFFMINFLFIALPHSVRFIIFNFIIVCAFNFIMLYISLSCYAAYRMIFSVVEE